MVVGKRPHVGQQDFVSVENQFSSGPSTGLRLGAGHELGFAGKFVLFHEDGEELVVGNALGSGSDQDRDLEPGVFLRLPLLLFHHDCCRRRLFLFGLLLGLLTLLLHPNLPLGLPQLRGGVPFPQGELESVKANFVDGGVKLSHHRRGGAVESHHGFAVAAPLFGAVL